MTYWHGGAGGLEVGDLVLPRAVTGVESNRTVGVERMKRLRFKSEETAGADRVYVTTSHATARGYARIHGTGTIYRVDPEGPLEHDPCSVDGRKCMSARVLSVEPLTVHLFFTTMRSGLDAGARYRGLLRGGKV